MMNVLFDSNGFYCRVAAVNLLPAYNPVCPYLKVVPLTLLQLLVSERNRAALLDGLHGLVVAGLLERTVDHISVGAGDFAPFDRRFPLARRQGFDGRFRQCGCRVFAAGRVAVQSIFAFAVCAERWRIRPDAIIVFRAGQTGRIFIGQGAVTIDCL